MKGIKVARLASFPGSQKNFSKSCETKSGTESLGTRLLQDPHSYLSGTKDLGMRLTLLKCGYRDIVLSSGTIFFHRYQQMTEREKRDFNLGDRNNDHGAWKHPSHLHPTSSQQQPTKPLPVLAKPVASVLSIWTSRQRSEANSYHLEFAGRRYGERAELYKLLNNSRFVLCSIWERHWTLEWQCLF